MTFFDISRKMLIANFQRYRLYFLCNVLSVSLFYCFAALFTNKLFMNPEIVHSMISSNIYAPSVFAGVFLMLFIPYSNQAFFKKRKYEYGILMTLGMNEKEVLKNMLLENSFMAVLSLVSGLLLGTILSFVFYFVIQQVIGIAGLEWYFNTDSYKVTAILYIITIFITLTVAIIGLLKMQIVELIREKYRAEGHQTALVAILIVGIMSIIFSIIIMIKGYGQKTEYIWYVSLFFMFSGLYMLFSQSERIKYYFGRLFPCYRKKHIIETAFIRQHDSSRKRITLIAAWLTGFSIFFGGLCGTLYPTMLQNAASYSPYDLVYSQIFGMNQAEDYKIQNLLKQNGIVVKEVKQVNYLRDRAFNMLPASQVNKEFGCNYQINPGQFLNIFQYELDDGYNHEMIPMEQLNFNCGRENLKLKSAGSDIRILFNDNPTFADYTLVLNDTDYNKLAIDYHECWKGTIKLYSFNEWKNSGKGIQAVQRYLFENNHIKQQEQNHYYKASSKIETFTIEKQSAQFLIFLMSFIMALFCGASSTIVYFKIKGEAEEEQRMLFGLYRIGITPEEMLNIIQYKNICYFMPQSILGICIGVFYNYTVNRIYGYQMTAVAYSLIIGFVLAAVQLAGTITYSRKELYSFGFLI